MSGETNTESIRKELSRYHEMENHYGSGVFIMVGKVLPVLGKLEGSERSVYGSKLLKAMRGGNKETIQGTVHSIYAAGNEQGDRMIKRGQF